MHEAGSQTTAPGNNEGGITVIGFLTTVTVDILGRTMASASTAFPSWSLVGIHASSTRAIGSALLTHGRSTGPMTGTTPTMFMSPTSTTAITCSTADIPTLQLR